MWLRNGLEKEVVHRIENRVLANPSSYHISPTDDVIDESILADVIEMCGQAPHGFFVKLLTAYIKSFDLDLAELQHASIENNALEIGAVSHRMKSGVSIFT